MFESKKIKLGPSLRFERCSDILLAFCNNTEAALKSGIFCFFLQGKKKKVTKLFQEIYLLNTRQDDSIMALTKRKREIEIQIVHCGIKYPFLTRRTSR